jgi:hypothetical protein
MRQIAFHRAAPRITRIALAASVLAALALPFPAFANSSAITGTYTTKITTPSQFKGTWTMTFAKGGGYTVADDGHIVIHGRYATTGSTITLGHESGPLSCAKTGTYTWRASATTLRFTRRSDAACTGRAGVLAHTFTRKR